MAIIFYKYCPKCGAVTPVQNSIECEYCNEKLLTSKYTMQDMFNGMNIRKVIFNEHIKDNPQFDKELYARREGKEKILQQASLDKQKEINKNTLSCPKCGSTAVSVGQKGYSLLTGFLGSGQTMNRCGKCGHKWTPRG